MKVFTNKHAQELRDHLIIMFYVHILFLFLEIFVYSISMSQIFLEIFYIWLTYYNYMTLSTCPIYLYCMLMVSALANGIIKLWEIGYIGACTILYMF